MSEGSQKETAILEAGLFETIPRDQREELARAVEWRTVPAHTVIFRQGDSPDNLYTIHSGRVRVFRRDETGVEIELSRMGPGETFGEMSLVTGEPRSASVESLEEAVLIVLPKEMFDRVVRDNPGVSLQLLKQVSTWLVRDEQALDRAARKELRAPRTSWIDFVGLIALSIFCALVFNSTNPNGIKVVPESWADPSVQKVRPGDIYDAYRAGAVTIVDARPANFFNDRHIQGALNVPLAIFEIMYAMALSGEDKDKEVVVYGRTISSLYDAELARKLDLRGFKKVRILVGGLSAWEAAGYPVEP